MTIQEVLADRPQSSALWTIGALAEMSKLGLLSGLPMSPTLKGTAMFDQLDAEFKPTDDEIFNALDAFGITNLSVRDGYTTMHLIKEFRDNRDRFSETAENINEID